MKEEHTNEKLLPCPFCGAKEYICVMSRKIKDDLPWYWVNCECSACVGGFQNKDEVVKLWNTRK